MTSSIFDFMPIQPMSGLRSRSWKFRLLFTGPTFVLLTVMYVFGGAINAAAFGEDDEGTRKTGGD